MEAGLLLGFFGLDDDVIDQAVVLGFLGAEELVALGVFFDLLDVLSGVFGEDFVELLFGFEYFFCLGPKKKL